MNAAVARRILGEEMTRSFHSVVADLRDAMYLGEVPGTQEVQIGDGEIELKYLLGDSAVLEVEPIGFDPKEWSQSHRVRLMRIVQNGKVLV